MAKTGVAASSKTTEVDGDLFENIKKNYNLKKGLKIVVVLGHQLYFSCLGEHFFGREAPETF